MGHGASMAPTRSTKFTAGEADEDFKVRALVALALRSRHVRRRVQVTRRAGLGAHTRKGGRGDEGAGERPMLRRLRGWSSKVHSSPLAYDHRTTLRTSGKHSS